MPCRVYLAHSVFDRERGNKVQERLEKLGFEIYNPLKEEEEHIVNLGWDVGDLIVSKRIVEIDLKGIRKSDLLLALIPDKKTFGTICEVMYAYIINVPIIIVCPRDMAKHPWIVAISKIVFTYDELERLYKYLETYWRVWIDSMG